MGQAESQPCCSSAEKLEIEQVASQAEGIQNACPESKNTVEDPISSRFTDKDLMRTNTSLLRGVPLHTTLRHWRRVWRRSPSELTMSQRAEVFEYSRQTEELDMFISHTWQTPGWRKFFSLLIRSGWRCMLTFWAVGTGLAFLLCCLDVLPLFYSSRAAIFQFQSVIPMGCWATLTGLVSGIGGLLLSVYLPIDNSSCFLDVACIPQTDDVLMRQGIYNIGGCLAVSRTLHVLWSPPFFSRLWCMFELSAYRKMNPTGRIVFAPIYIEAFSAQVFIWLHLVGLMMVFFRASYDEGGVGVLAMWVFVAMCLFPLALSLRANSLDRQRMLAALDQFEVREVQCLNDFDRNYIHTAIVSWYGSLDAFSDYVRGPFRQEVQVPLQLPYAYHCVLATPFFATSLDFVVGLLKAGAPIESVLAYTVSVLVGLNLLWTPAALALLVFACEHLPEHSFKGSRYLQTLAISLAMWLLYVIGLTCSVGSYVLFSSFWPVLVWTAGALLFASVVWRFCWW